MHVIIPLLTLLIILVPRIYSIEAGKPINAIIIGGSSGIGKGTALETVKRGGKCIIVSSNKEKLEKAANEIHSIIGRSDDSSDKSIFTEVLDVTDEEAVSKFAQKLDDKSPGSIGEIKWDGLVFSAAGRAPHGSIETLPTSETKSLFDTKFWGAYLSAKYISKHLSQGGCIVFVGGVLNRRPGINCSPLASVNGALEGLTRSLALELGPKIRVNCLSPGFCDTERFDHMPIERKDAMLRNTAESLPLKRYVNGISYFHHVQ